MDRARGSETRRPAGAAKRIASRSLLFSETRDELLARLRRRPRSAGLQRRLAAVRILEGRWAEASEGLSLARSHCPDAAVLHSLHAYVRVEGEGETPAPLRSRMDEYVAGPPSSPLMAYLGAWFLLRTNQAARAIDRIEAIQPGGAHEIWRGVALYHFLKAAGRTKDAAGWRARVGRQHPLLERHLGDDASAADRFWNPLLAVGADSLARQACRRQYWLLARTFWEEAFLLDPRPALLEMRMALIPADGSEEEGRLVHLDRAVQASPRCGAARFALGVEYARQGFLRRACRELAVAWRMGGAEVWLAGSWAPRALQRRLLGEAAAAFMRAVEGRRVASVLRDGYVRVLLGIGRFEEALLQLEIVEEVEVNRADFYLRRGGALLGLGRLQEGMSNLDRAVCLGVSRRVAREVLEVFGRAGLGAGPIRPAEE